MASLEPTTTFYGWRIVAAVFVLAVFGWGIGFYGPPIYLHAVHEARGWPLDLISAAMTLHFVLGAIAVSNLPKLYRRFGVANVTKGGAIALATGVMGWALAREPWQLLFATLFSGGGWAAMGAAAVNAIVAPWFVRARPAALAFAYNGSSIGGIVFSSLWVIAIGVLGFPGAAAVIGLATIATVWILADVYYSKTPEALRLCPDGNAGAEGAPDASSLRGPLPQGQLSKDRRFITLAAGMALGLFAQIGLIAQLFSLLVAPLGVHRAGFAMGAATAAAIAGRTLVGWVMPGGADRRLFAGASYLVQTLGSIALLLAAGNDAPLLWLGVVLFGAGIGNATSLPPLIAQVEFAKEDVPRVVSLIVAISQAAYAFAPMAFGLLRDLGPPAGSSPDGAAPWVFIAAAIVQAAAITALLAGRRDGMLIGRR
jgi:hypothetical protein